LSQYSNGIYNYDVLFNYSTDHEHWKISHLCLSLLLTLSSISS